MGLFSPGHLPYALERDTSPTGQPSLLNMTQQALKLLSKNPKGYVLVVEGGNIDNAHHDGYARHALHETSEMDDAVAYAAQVTNPDDTLIIVTADHSHTLTIGGYAERGADILGLCKRTCNSKLMIDRCIRFCIILIYFYLIQFLCLFITVQDILTSQHS
jgi:alkaline phosphatase